MASSSSSSSSSSGLQIYRATFNGNLQQLKRLCKEMDTEKGVSERLAKLKTFHGQGLLLVAAYKGWINICKYFMEDLNFNVDEKDNEGKTPLLSASSGGHLSTFLYLIENGADPAALDHFKTNSLHIAASKGHIEIVSLLLSKGVDVDALSDFVTPLQMAALCYKRDVLKLLLDHGANPNRVSNLVPTPLSFSVCERTIQCTKLLLEAGADPNGMTCGKTPLGCAAKEGKVNIIKCLLEAGADPNITDDLGMKPIEVAALNKKHPEVKILFPVTSPIPAYLDWSITGIMKHVHSEEARQQRKLRLKDKCLEIKTKGDDALKRKEYVQADFYYGEAIVLDPSDATVFSNKSLCSANLGRGDEAWSLAKVCIMLRPDWSEAYNRAGVALSLLKKFDMAADAFCMGSKLDPEDKELQDGFRKAVEAKMNSVRT